MLYSLVTVVSCDKTIIHHIMIYLNGPPSSANPTSLHDTTRHGVVSLTINPGNFLNRRHTVHGSYRLSTAGVTKIISYILLYYFIILYRYEELREKIPSL